MIWDKKEKYMGITVYQLHSPESLDTIWVISPLELLDLLQSSFIELSI